MLSLEFNSPKTKLWHFDITAEIYFRKSDFKSEQSFDLLFECELSDACYYQISSDLGPLATLFKTKAAKLEHEHRAHVFINFDSPFASHELLPEPFSIPNPVSCTDSGKYFFEDLGLENPFSMFSTANTPFDYATDSWPNWNDLYVRRMLDEPIHHKDEFNFMDSNPTQPIASTGYLDSIQAGHNTNYSFKPSWAPVIPGTPDHTYSLPNIPRTVPTG